MFFVPCLLNVIYLSHLSQFLLVLSCIFQSANNKSSTTVKLKKINIFFAFEASFPSEYHHEYMSEKKVLIRSQIKGTLNLNSRTYWHALVCIWDMIWREASIYIAVWLYISWTCHSQEDAAFEKSEQTCLTFRADSKRQSSEKHFWQSMLFTIFLSWKNKNF